MEARKERVAMEVKKGSVLVESFGVLVGILGESLSGSLLKKVCWRVIQGLETLRG